MSEQINMWDVGTSFEVTVYDKGSPKDVSEATTITLKFRKPDNTVVLKEGVFVSSGTDGKIRYVTEEEFLDFKGQWDLQVQLEFADGSKWNTNIANFHVHPII